MDEMIDRSKGQWFVVHTLSGKENKVKETLESKIRVSDDNVPVYEVLIPTEKIVEVKNGKRRTITRKIFPGYVYIRMDLYKPSYGDRPDVDDKAWDFVNSVQGVISFIGGGDHPQPLSASEVEDLIRQTEAQLDNKNAGVAKIPPYISIGAAVRIIDGAFANFEGTIEEIDAERGKLKLMVSIFGRKTPVELEFWQVGPDEK